MLRSPKTIGLIGVIVILSGVLSVFVSNLLFSGEDKLTTQVEEVDSISSEFNYTGKSYFTDNPLNPTKDITIESNNNQQPLPTATE